MVDNRKTQKLINSLKPQTQEFTPIATDMFLPNHSGDLSAGKVRTTPTQDLNVVNKKYVDDAIAAIPTSAAGSAYFQAYRTATFDITNNNTWYDYPWTLAATLNVGFTHNNAGANPEQITITTAGIYQIHFRANFSLVSAGGCIRLLLSGTEIAGSYVNQSTNGTPQTINETLIVSCAANDIIEAQVANTTAGTDIVYVDVANAPNPTTFISTTISIIRIA